MKELDQKIVDQLHAHQLADESFQNAQQIHNLEMHAAQVKTEKTMARMEEKLDSWIKVADSLSFSGKLVIKIFGVIVAIAAGIAALKYLIIGFIK